MTGEGTEVRLRFGALPPAWRFIPGALFDRSPPIIPDHATVPRVEASADVRPDPARLETYRRLCGSTGAYLPIGYPQMLALPLVLAVLSHRSVPVRPMGVVHVGQRLWQSRDVGAEESFRLVTHMEGYREVERGQELDIETEAVVDGEVAWYGCTTILLRRPGRRRTGRGSGPEMPPEDAVRQRIEVPPGIGFSYARLSGDFNPIHLWPSTARPFGFPRPIVHGMWSLARCLGAAEVEGPADVVARFRLPLGFPGEVTLNEWDAGAGGRRLLLTEPGGSKPHLEITVRDL